MVELLMRGWRGVWIGAADLSVRIPESSRKLHFEHEWVTLDNCVDNLRSVVWLKIGADQGKSRQHGSGRE